MKFIVLSLYKTVDSNKNTLTETNCKIAILSIRHHTNHDLKVFQKTIIISRNELFNLSCNAANTKDESVLNNIGFNMHQRCKKLYLQIAASEINCKI